jgi:short-subunit dehydrogenase
MDLTGKKILVTGASAGIGECTARSLAQAGAFVILTARNLERLEVIVAEIRKAGFAACAFSADLTRAEDRTRLLREVRELCGGIDVLVNNAGFGWYGFGDQMGWPVAAEMIGLNVEAVVHLTLELLSEMKARQSGHIINIGSIAADLPAQGIALYSATKAFIDNFSVSLYRETRGSGVRISLVKPGPVKTAFFTRAALRLQTRTIPGGRFGIRPETVARRILALVRHPRKILYLPGIYSLLPVFELLFSRIMDLVGPLLLKKANGYTP